MNLEMEVDSPAALDAAVPAADGDESLLEDARQLLNHRLRVSLYARICVSQRCICFVLCCPPLQLS